MAVDIASITTEEDTTALEEIVNGAGTASLHYLQRLRTASRPMVETIVDGLEKNFGLRSEISAKRDATAVEKVQRPATLKRYPWFSLAHIRDYLRFRTHLRRAADFESVLSRFVRLQASGDLDIVKVDTAKLARPGAFGWRMIATDIRISTTGLMVEHYMTFGDMIAVNEAWLHKVYEAWRSKETDRLTMRELVEMERDTRFSRHAYRELLFDGILTGVPTRSGLLQGRKAAGDAVLASLTKALNLP